MSDIIVDGRTTVWFLPTIASPQTGPTLAEITAGVRISKYLIPTGLTGFETAQAEIDNSGLEDATDTKLPGRKSYSGTSVTFKEQASDVAFTAIVTAMAESTDGYIVIRDGILASVAAAAAQKVELYGVRTGVHSFLGRGEANALLRRQIMTPVSSTVNKTAALAA